jgi:hypothetical protein
MVHWRRLSFRRLLAVVGAHGEHGVPLGSPAWLFSLWLPRLSVSRGFFHADYDYEADRQ